MKKLNFRLVLLILQVITIKLMDGKKTLMLVESHDLAVITAKIIKSCHGDSVKEVGAAGNLSNSFFAPILSDDPIGIVTINDDKRSVQSGSVSKWSLHKLHVFVIMATSRLELDKILVGIKNTRWWNYAATFYIFVSSGEDCSQAHSFLWTAWTMNILGAKFICNHNAKGPLIYTFNPYTEYAPYPWKVEDTYRGVNDHPWSLVVRKYYGELNVCETINFYQSINCGGYEVRLSATQNQVVPNPPVDGKFSPLAHTNNILSTMSRYINITLKTAFHPQHKSIGFVNEDGRGHGMLEDLINGQSDIIFRINPLSIVPLVSQTYPTLYHKLFAVTQYAKYVPQWRKVVSAIDERSRIGVCVVMVVTVVFLKYALRQSFGTAILNTIRIICSSCLTKLPNNFGPRIYLACLFCFVITIEALFHGQLAALLSMRTRYKSVNSFVDLAQSDYLIFGRFNDSAVFSDPAFNGRFVGINYFVTNCTDYVLQNNSNVCVGGREMLMNASIDLKLHMSKNPIAELYFNWFVRKDWPLTNRLNRHNSHYVESGLYDYDYERAFAERHSILELNEHGYDDERPKVFNFVDLNFAFTILVIGWGCAIAAFVVELYIGRRRLSREQTRARVRSQFQSRLLQY